VVTGAGVISSIGAGIEEFERQPLRRIFRNRPQSPARRNGHRRGSKKFHPAAVARE